MSFPAIDCARARESLSAQVDGELSVLEQDRLETHLLLCPACAPWAEQVQELTARLREARLEEPAERFSLPQRRRTRETAPVALVAAVAASLVAVLGASHSLLGTDQPVRSSLGLPQASAPAVTGLEVQRLGLDSVPTRLSGAPQARFRAL